MTDISKEAVERLAHHIQSTCGCALGENAEQSVAATLRAQATHIAAQDAKIAKLVEALREIADTNGGNPIDRNNRMKKASRQALASIGETDD